MIMKNGDIVKVQVYGGKKLNRRVVKEGNDVVLLCSEEEYNRALSDGREPSCIGFPKHDVIAYGSPMAKGKKQKEINQNGKANDDKTKPGPSADHVKLKGDWEAAVKKALKKKRPPEGWPEEGKKEQKK